MTGATVTRTRVGQEDGTLDQWIPGATRDEHAATPELTYTEHDHPKGVLHTTEGGDWPTYRGWKIPPHLTVKVVGNEVEVRQHVPLNRASFALRNAPGGAQTNRDNVVQVELVGTCDPKAHAAHPSWYYWPDASDQVLDALYHAVIVPVRSMRGVPLAHPTFIPYPRSYGEHNGVRFTGPEWDDWSGWCGHQHVPENTHGDPGAFPAAILFGMGREHPPAAHKPTGTEKIVQSLPLLERGDSGAPVKRAQALANLAGADPSLKVDGEYGPKTVAGVKDVQRRHGLTEDGKVGPRTWASLLGVTL